MIGDGRPPALCAGPGHRQCNGKEQQRGLVPGNRLVPKAVRCAQFQTEKWWSSYRCVEQETDTVGALRGAQRAALPFCGNELPSIREPVSRAVERLGGSQLCLSAY